MKSCTILLVNWNGWADTLECLESLFRLDRNNWRVLVCDNGSVDGSLDLIKAWAEGRLDVWLPPDDPHRNLKHPPVAKFFSYASYSRQDAEAGGDLADDSALVLIDNLENLGFAGGNNVGLRYLMARNDYDYVWLLNNDTVVDSNALDTLAERMAEKPDAGMCGSTLLRYYSPGRIQVCGGAYYCSWIGLPWHFGQLSKRENLTASIVVEKLSDYIVGASLFVSREFLETVGLISEDYFLYYEELDWAIRAKGKFTLAYAPDSFVYHKVGASIGTSSDPRKKSSTCDYYSIRNRIRITRRYFPYAIVTVYIGLFLAALIRLACGQWHRAAMIARLMVSCGKDVPQR